MIINSNKVTIQCSAKEVADFLRDSNNLIHLLPQDKITDYKSSVSECSFKVQGGIIITLVQDGSEDDVKVFLKSGASSPFPFKLTVHIEPSENSVEGYLKFDGEVNMFLKMMVEKPLTNLFNYMSEKLEEHFRK